MNDLHILDYEEIESEIWGDTKPKPEPKQRDDFYHFPYIMVLVCIFFFEVVSYWASSATKSDCEFLCEPYRLESCGEDAHTATCRTPEGFIVRSEK